MKSLFEEMGGTYRQEGDYLIPEPLRCRTNRNTRSASTGVCAAAI